MISRKNFIKNSRKQLIWLSIIFIIAIGIFVASFILEPEKEELYYPNLEPLQLHYSMFFTHWTTLAIGIFALYGIISITCFKKNANIVILDGLLVISLLTALGGTIGTICYEIKNHTFWWQIPAVLSDRIKSQNMYYNTIFDWIQHLIIPVLLVVYWTTAFPKHKTSWKSMIWVVIFQLCWLAYSLIVYFTSDEMNIGFPYLCNLIQYSWWEILLMVITIFIVDNILLALILGINKIMFKKTTKKREQFKSLK